MARIFSFTYYSPILLFGYSPDHLFLSVATTPVWSRPITDTLQDIRISIENTRRALEEAQNLTSVDLDPEHQSVPIYNDSTAVMCFSIENGKKYKGDPLGLGFTLIPNDDMGAYDKYIEPQGAVLVSRPLMYFLNCINSYQRVPIQDFKGRGEIYILPELIERDYERWLDEQVA